VDGGTGSSELVTEQILGVLLGTCCLVNSALHLMHWEIITLGTKDTRQLWIKAVLSEYCKKLDPALKRQQQLG